MNYQSSLIPPELLNKRRLLRRVVQVFILICIFLMALTPIDHENDIFWQLKMGEKIWHEHYFPVKDIFSFTAYGDLWTLEEWIPSTIFYVLNHYYGVAVLILFKALLVTLTFSLFFLLFNKLKINLYISFLVFLLAALVNTRGVWVVFPSIFEYLFLVLTIFVIEYFKEANFKYTAIFLSLLSLLWANSHGSFFLLTFVIVCYILGSLLVDKIKQRYPSYQPVGLVLNKVQRIRLLIVASISLITPFISPNGYFLFIYPFRISLSKFTGYVGEYQKYWVIWNWDFNDFVHGFTFILIVLLIFLFLISIKKLNPIDLLLAAVFTGLASIAVRHVAIFALVALFIISKYISVWFGEYRGYFKRSLTKDLLLILFIVCFSYFYKTHIAPFGFDLKETGYPKELAEFVNKHKIAGNMFNHYNYGGYLIWKMPDYKVFIDGRLEMYLGQVGQDYLVILNGQDGYQNLLDKYRVNFIIAYNIDPIVGRLVDDQDWRYISSVSQYVLFVKNSTQNQQIIKQFWNSDKEKEYRALYKGYLADEYNNQGVIQVRKGNLLKGLDYFQQALDLKPDFLAAHLNLAQGYFDIGWWNEAKDENNLILKFYPDNQTAKDNLQKLEKMKVIQKLKKL